MDLYDLARELETERPEGDTVLADPAPDNEGVYRQQWVEREVKPEEAMANAKAARHSAVSSIVVETAARNKFDGNEDAQNRMTRALVGLADGAAIDWVLADNSIATVDKAELAEALYLAGAEQSRLWVLPYTEAGK